MRQKAILEREGYKHITTRINTFTLEKEHLFYNKRYDESVIVKEVKK